MNWLKKLLGIRSRPQGLGHRYAPRAVLWHRDDISFFPDPSHRHPLSNLSTGGLGLIRGEPGAAWPTAVGEIMKGTLALADERFEVSLRVAHLTSDALGGPFVGQSPEMTDRMLAILDAEFAAARLEPRAPGELIGEFEGNARIFSGDGGEEVLIVDQNGKIVRFQLVFLGNIVEWLPDGKLLSGFLDERLHLEENSWRPGQPLMRHMKPVDTSTAVLAARFASAVEGLDTHSRTQIIQLLKRALA